MVDVLDRTYHIIVGVNGQYPTSETYIVPLCMGTDIDTSFFLYGEVPGEGKSTRYMAITIEEPYEDGSSYTPVVPAEQDEVEIAIRNAMALLGNEYYIEEHPNTEIVCSYNSEYSHDTYTLFRTTLELEESNSYMKHYDRYKVCLYFSLVE